MWENAARLLNEDSSAINLSCRTYATATCTAAPYTATTCDQEADCAAGTTGRKEQAHCIGNTTGCCIRSGRQEKAGREADTAACRQNGVHCQCALTRYDACALISHVLLQCPADLLYIRTIGCELVPFIFAADAHTSAPLTVAAQQSFSARVIACVSLCIRACVRSLLQTASLSSCTRWQPVPIDAAFATSRETAADARAASQSRHAVRGSHARVDLHCTPAPLPL